MFNRQFSTILILLALTTTGCANTEAIRSRTETFGSALTTTTDGVKKSFDLAETAYRNRAIDLMTINYARGAQPRPEIEPLFSTTALKARLDTLSGLNAYASTLTTIVGGSAQAELATNSQALAEDLKKLNDQSFKGTRFQLSDAAVAGIGTAVNALGDIIISAKIRSQLPPIIKRMDGSVKKIVFLFNADLGSPGEAGLGGGSGLRGILSTSYRDSLSARDELLHLYFPPAPPHKAPGRPTMTPDVLRSEVSGITGFYSNADKLMSATQDALQDLISAHEKLIAAADSRDVSVDVAIQNFAREAAYISDYYSKLLSDLKKGT